MGMGNRNSIISPNPQDLLGYIGTSPNIPAVVGGLKFPRN